MWPSLNLALEQPCVLVSHLCPTLISADSCEMPQITQWSCRAWEIQFPFPYRKLSPSFGAGSLGLLLGPTHFFTLSSISQFDLSALPVVTVGTFWCLHPLLDIFMFSFYMIQNCCLGFGEILNLYQFFSNSLTDSGQEVPGSEYRISLPCFCHAFPRDQLALLNWGVLCVTPNLRWNSQLWCESQREWE